MYEKDNRIFTFHQFESYDGAKWTEILKPGETRKGAFKITFDPRLVSQIRVRGRSTLNDHLHFVRFQAFNISGKASLLIPSSDPPFFQSTGLYNGVMTSDNRDSAWKVIALPGGTSFKAGENAFIQKPHPGWKPAASATAGWIGVTSNGEDGIPVGDYEFQTTFTIPSPYTALEVNFAVDDNLKSVVVSNGTTITSFNGNGFGQWSNFTATGLIPGAVTTMTFKVYNSGGALGLLVQFGAFLVTPPPTSSGIRKLSSDSSRDASWKVISLPGGTSFKAGDNAYIQSGGWTPASSATSGWIGITPSDRDAPVGDYEFQTTFTIPSPYTALDVNFAVDNNLNSVVVSNGTTITSFSGNGFGKWSNFTATGLIPGAVTTMTFKVYNSGGGLALLVQFGAYK
jgi:hypothetical protein